MIRARLLIYTKPPRMGLSKTRLADGVGQAEARRIARFTLSRAMVAARGSGCETILYLTPDWTLHETLGGLWPPFLPRRPQGPGTLTERLGKGLKETSPGPVIFIGTDTPDISAALIRRAVVMLARFDAVFGPAEDGGFWLFGLNANACTPSPFHNVRWSGPHAMEDVQRNLPSGFRTGLLPTLADIDERDDWIGWRKAQNHKS